MAKRHVLDGVRVLDFSQHVAGPACTRMMAEMGAEVIKLELAPLGEQIRNVGFKVNGRSVYFIQQNRGKKSLCLDMKSPAGRELVYELVKRVDVVVENFAPGAIGRLGLPWARVRELNPECIMCSISTFGQEGPLAGLPGYDFIGQAYAGVTSMIGDRDNGPYIPIAALGDTTTGAHALAAINGALYHRATAGGGGQFLDISLLDCYFHSHEMNVGAVSASGGAIDPYLPGRHHQAVAPLGVYKSRDGYLILIAILGRWKDFCAAMGRPELIADPRFVDDAARVAHHAELKELIETWLQAQESDEHTIRLLGRHHVPVAPILSIRQAMNLPHLRQRGTVRTITDRGAGRFDIPGMPLRFSAFTNDLDLQAPYLGEHNAEILGGLLGVGARRLAELTAEGVLVAEPLPA
ncbi:MAG: CaiB/BaiF CoA transferase family protein [Pseudomonadota bacterium]|jgi:crotonobetainyl-CoA:carnitine CoA-transferase CaiB-like acyl-CoA transferase